MGNMSSFNFWLNLDKSAQNLGHFLRRNISEDRDLGKSLHLFYIYIPVLS